MSESSRATDRCHACKVRGRCPSCGSDSLFLGTGGYVTCSIIGCKDPGAANKLLEEPGATLRHPNSDTVIFTGKTSPSMDELIERNLEGFVERASQVVRSRTRSIKNIEERPLRLHLHLDGEEVAKAVLPHLPALRMTNAEAADVLLGPASPTSVKLRVNVDLEVVVSPSTNTLLREPNANTYTRLEDCLGDAVAHGMRGWFKGDVEASIRNVEEVKER